MKLRNGFVSNSSTSSYILCFDTFPSEQNFLKILKKKYTEDDLENVLHTYVNLKNNYDSNKIIQPSDKDRLYINKFNKIYKMMIIFRGGNDMYGMEDHIIIPKIGTSEIPYLKFDGEGFLLLSYPEH